MINVTLAENLAISILRGNHHVADMLVDQWLAERMERQTPPVYESRRLAPLSSMEVFLWPEFRAFAERLGFKFNLMTREVVIKLSYDQIVTIDHNYLGEDTTVVRAGEQPTMDINITPTNGSDFDVVALESQMVAYSDGLERYMNQNLDAGTLIPDSAETVITHEPIDPEVEDGPHPVLEEQKETEDPGDGEVHGQ